MKFCTVVFGITLTVTTLKIIFHVMFPPVGAILTYFWAYFGVWFSVSWEPFNIFWWIFLQIFKNFIDPQQGHYEETVYFLPLSLQKVLGLVILFSLNPPPSPSLLGVIFMSFWAHVIFAYVFLCLKNLNIFWWFIFAQKLCWVTHCLDILGYFTSILVYVPQIIENFIWIFVHWFSFLKN